MLIINNQLHNFCLVSIKSTYLCCGENFSLCFRLIHIEEEILKLKSIRESFQFLKNKEFTINVNMWHTHTYVEVLSKHGFNLFLLNLGIL